MLKTSLLELKKKIKESPRAVFVGFLAGGIFVFILANFFWGTMAVQSSVTQGAYTALTDVNKKLNADVSTLKKKLESAEHQRNEQAVATSSSVSKAEVQNAKLQTQNKQLQEDVEHLKQENARLAKVKPKPLSQNNKTTDLVNTNIRLGSDISKITNMYNDIAPKYNALTGQYNSLLDSYNQYRKENEGLRSNVLQLEARLQQMRNNEIIDTPYVLSKIQPKGLGRTIGSYQIKSLTQDAIKGYDLRITVGEIGYGSATKVLFHTSLMLKPIVVSVGDFLVLKDANNNTLVVSISAIGSYRLNYNLHQY